MFDETPHNAHAPETPLPTSAPIVTQFAADSPEASKYRAILQRKIDEGTRRAAEVIATIQRDQPRDQILRMRATAFDVTPAGVRVHVADDRYQPTDFALGQIAGRAGIPHPYLRELASPDAAPWQHDLAREILAHHHANAGDGRVLVRSVRGQLRGWVSDRYRRLDARPLVEALADEALRAGAVPVDGTVTETRVALKVILPRILAKTRSVATRRTAPRCGRLCRRTGSHLRNIGWPPRVFDASAATIAHMLATDRLREDLGLHPHDVELIVRRLERRVGRGFPHALLEVIETVDELSRLVALRVSRRACEGVETSKHDA